MISSLIPSLKYSSSGSALMLTKGNTAIEVGAATAACSPEASRAAANASAVSNRSAGDLASACMMAASMWAGTPPRRSRTEGTGSPKHLAMMARVVAPVYGGSPASISNSTQPSEYTSVRPSSVCSPLACSGLM